MLLNTVRVLSLGLMALVLGAMANAAGTLVFCSEGSPEGFDPALYTTGTTFDASSRQIYNKLVEVEQGTTLISPALAESYSVSEDGLEYTFNIRPGVKFHTTDYFTPTRDLNASDVVFSFERQRVVDNPYHRVSGGTWEYFNAMSMPDLIESIVALDDLTVKFTLTRREAPVIANMALDFASILSREYADAMLAAGTPEKLNQQPIGTGPFKFVGYEQDAVIRYQSHEDYWAGKPAIDELVFAITPDSAQGYQKLLSGECHVLGAPAPADLDAMRQDPELRVLQQEGLNVGYLAYNTSVAPFDNVNVRKALNMAIDKQAILDAVFNGKGRAAKNPIPPTVWSYNDSVEDDPYDPARARAMLEAEGVTDLKMQIWPMPVVRPFNPNAVRMAEVIQSAFADINVEVEIVLLEWADYLRLSKEPDRPAAVLFGWTGDNGDPDNFLAVLLGCDAVGNSNRAQWCHEPFNDLIQQAKVISDHAERAKLYEQAQVIFKNQAPWATIAHSLVHKTVRSEVQDFTIDPFGGNIFYGVSLAD